MRIGAGTEDEPQAPGDTTAVMTTERILVGYATEHGSTREVAEAVADDLRDHGFAVELLAAGEVDGLERYDGVVLGGALYMGRWHRDARAFLKRHRAALSRLPLAVFGMGPKTVAPDEVAASRAQLDRSLAKTPELSPERVAIFGGVLDPAGLRFPFNRMPPSDARDWDAVHAWAMELGDVFSGQGAPSARVIDMPLTR